MFNINEAWIYSENQNECRLDKYLVSKIPGQSRSQIQHWLKQGCFRVNNKIASKNLTLKSNDIISIIKLPAIESTLLKAQNIPLDIVYQDSDIAVINKAKNMIVHPGNGNPDNTMANAILYHFKDIDNPDQGQRPGIVHRLDKDTTGLLVIAKNDFALQALTQNLKNRMVKRTYHAMAWQQCPDTSGEIDAPVGRHTHDRVKMCVTPNGRPALTKYQVIAHYEFATLFQLNLVSGRTHQIRVHLSHIGHPIVGDSAYGGHKFQLPPVQTHYRPAAQKLLSYFTSQALHAKSLCFHHPRTGEFLEFETPLPPEFQEALNFMQRYKITSQNIL